MQPKEREKKDISIELKAIIKARHKRNLTLKNSENCDGIQRNLINVKSSTINI